jgi:hypothetical protein
MANMLLEDSFAQENIEKEVNHLATKDAVFIEL